MTLRGLGEAFIALFACIAVAWVGYSWKSDEVKPLESDRDTWHDSFKRERETNDNLRKMIGNLPDTMTEATMIALSPKNEGLVLVFPETAGFMTVESRHFIGNIKNDQLVVCRFVVGAESVKKTVFVNTQQVDDWDKYCSVK